MATYQELNNYYKKIFNKDLQRATLARWVKEKRFSAVKETNGKYNYNLEEFKQVCLNPETQIKIKATKENPKDYIGKISGQLLIKGIVPREEYKGNYQGTLMYCDCLNCGKTDVQVRFSYLTGNGNYSQETCGCRRKEKAFLASSRAGIDNIFISLFSEDFEKFLQIHKMLIKTTNKYYANCDVEIYKEAILYFWNDNQFNKVYDFWKKEREKEEKNTFYDWAKPSLDHKIPKSKGGTDELKNLQVLTVFENLSKRDMSQEEWEAFKEKTKTTSSYFIENIL